MTIQVFQPLTGDEEITAVANVLNSNWLGKGAKVAQFESAWADHIGVNSENVVSISTCTEGLFQAVELLGIGEGDEVIIPSIHFIGAANAVLKVGGKPVFCDVNPKSLNGSSYIFNHITPKTKAVIILHYGGIPSLPFDLQTSQFQLLKRWGIAMIEDSACSPASLLNSQPAGTFGDIAVWSFDAMKIMTTGDGGMVYCRDPQLAKRLRHNIYLGQDTVSGLTSPNSRWWEFESVGPGRRAIMNDITAAIGLEQLKKLPAFVARRKKIWHKYNQILKDVEWLTLPPSVPDYVQSSYYFYWVQLEKRDELAAYLRGKDIYTTFRYYPLHRVFKTGQKLPGADYAADHTLLLPLHQGLTDSEVEYVGEMVRQFGH